MKNGTMKWVMCRTINTYMNNLLNIILLLDEVLSTVTTNAGHEALGKSVTSEVFQFVILTS